MANKGCKFRIHERNVYRKMISVLPYFVTGTFFPTNFSLISPLWYGCFLIVYFCELVVLLSEWFCKIARLFIYTLSMKFNGQIKFNVKQMLQVVDSFLIDHAWYFRVSWQINSIFSSHLSMEHEKLQESIHFEYERKK